MFLFSGGDTDTEIGRTISKALEIARQKHAWSSRRLMVLALLSEVAELTYEILCDSDEQAIRNEALDVATVALRIRDGL